MLTTSTGLGTEAYVAVLPKLADAGARRGVIVTHGRGADHTTPVFGPYGLAPGVPATLADAGSPVLSIAAGGQTAWGNDASTARVSDAWTALKATYGAKTDKVCFYGASMGALVALNWARANPTQVAALALHLPAADLADIHDNNRGGYATEIETALGGAGSVASHNPAAHPADLEGIPIKLWYASNDTIVVPAAVLAFAAATGAQTADLGAVGHTTNTLDPLAVAAFLAPYL